MKLIREVPEDVVYSYWFIHEAKGRDRDQYSIFLQQYLEYRSLVENPNMNDEDENRERAKLFRKISGRREFIKTFPSDTKWHQAEVNERDFRNLYVLKDDLWYYLSNCTGKLSKTSDNVYTQQNCLSKTLSRKSVPYIIGMLREIDIIDKKLILIGNEKIGFTIMDGVHRAIAIYIHNFIEHRGTFNPIEVFAGVSREKCEWQP